MVYKKFKYVSVGYNNYIESVAKLIAEHYDTKENKDTLFLISTYADNGYLLTRDQFSEKRVIFYNLEHYETLHIDFSCLFNESYIPWLRTFKPDEIWDFAIENLKYIPEDLQYKLKFMPMRYTSTLFNEPYNIPKTFDFAHVGVIKAFHPHRMNIICDIQYLFDQNQFKCNTNFHEAKFKLIKGKTIYDLKYDLSNCRYILDTLNNRRDVNNMYIQNQVRIFECIMNGYNVLTEAVNGVDYFSGIVKTFEYPADDEREESVIYGIDLLNKLNETYEDRHIENREIYKNLTYRDEDFENYKENIKLKYEKLINKEQ